MFDEYNTLQDTFNQNLAQYGVDIEANGKQIKALFILGSSGLNDGKSKDQFLTMFTRYEDNVVQGSVIKLKDKYYLTLKDSSNENTLYDRSKCLECNQVIKYELRYADDSTKADLVTFNAYGDALSASVLGSSDVLTLQSTCHFTFPLNDLTRRIVSA